MKELILDTAAMEKAAEYKILLTTKFNPGLKKFVFFVFVGMILLSAVLFGYNLIKSLQIHNDLLDRKAQGLVSPRVPVVSGFHVMGPSKKKDSSKGGGLHHNALSDKFIAEINSRGLLWQAGRNFHVNTPMAYIKKLMGVKRDQSMKVVAMLLSVHKPPLVDNQTLPTEFDARTKWPQCESITEIRHQGGCGSCWAFGAAETMTDRQCIHKNETFHYSAADLVSCCVTCGNGCDGGFLMSAFVHWKTDGIVSGGAYDSHQGCSPYEVEPCKHLVPGKRISCSGITKTPDCTKQCDGSYNSTYDQDHRFAQTVYTLSHEEDILRDLVENGPVAASFDVYEDFLHYKSGVYYHVEGSLLGGHAIRVLGFGVEGGVPYYLCANSWNFDWGNGGFFKIRRDQMYENMVAGIPA